MLTGSKDKRTPLPPGFSVEQFDTLIRKAERPILAAFLAPWSRPCQLLAPIVRDLQVSYEGNVEVISIDADSHPELGVCYEVNSIPTLLYFFAGRMLARQVGFVSKQAIISQLDQLPSVVSLVRVATHQPLPSGSITGPSNNQRLLRNNENHPIR